jgi:hypothetical protein
MILGARALVAVPKVLLVCVNPVVHVFAVGAAIVEQRSVEFV